ncbi:FtsK/SpoIIIE domain-containing protein [Herbidospora sp. NBRC 101105]|uniref:FtsK/SpoIIIE domain-containing protein n=1 Tax=Herbidospora sp. NBRC 101105 TaxID=3032195 RepID=UPI002556655E|nr:FtsK/SpoIIIE domain-containing protein [Herbidospora sp. NBRC 101105]
MGRLELGPSGRPGSPSPLHMFREDFNLVFRKLPGDEARNLVTTTPDTKIVFKPVVVSTPAFLTIGLWIIRLIAGLVRLIWRHPIAVTLVGGLAALAILVDWRGSVFLVGLALPVLASWAVIHRPSFSSWIAWPLLASWRRFWIYRRHWQPVMVVSGLGRHLHGRDYLPRLVNVACTPWADLVVVRMLKGQCLEDWTKRADHLAQGFGATGCRVTLHAPGVVLLVLPRRDPLADPIPALPLRGHADEPPVEVEPVEVGEQEDGQPYRLKVHGTHVLIAGATGAGKGSWIWSIIRALLPAMAAGLVQVWALDPKRMELSLGKPLFDGRYAATPEECADLLETAVAQMQQRADKYAGVRRSHTATPDEPFVLVVVDEVAFLTAYQSDKHLKQRITAALATLTTQGRAVGFGVLAALQDPRKEVMNIRNLFPDKIALRLDESEQVDMVLGDGARDRGALADLISPNPAQGAGIGYARLETSPDPIRVRATYVSDDDIAAMVAFHESARCALESGVA